MGQETKHFLIITVLVLLLFSGGFFCGSNCIIWGQHSDLIGFNLGKVELMHKEGLLPLFDPNTNSGYPLAASPLAMAFYIPLFPAYLSGNLFIYNIVIFFQMLLAGIFMYLLARNFKASHEGALLASVMYMFSGYFLTYIEFGHINHIMNFTFFPLIFLLFRKIFEKGNIVYSIFLSYAIALSYFSGHPQFLMYIMILCFVYMAYNFFVYFKSNRMKKFFKKIFYIGLAFIISIFLILPSLLPTLSFSKLVMHGDTEKERWDFVSSFSFHPVLTIRFLFPNAFGDKYNYISYADYSESPYVSLFGLFSVILSFYLVYKKKMKREKALVVFLFMLSYFLMLGGYNPFYYLLFEYVPGFNLFRGSSRVIMTATFCASLLSAFVFDFLFRNKKYFALFRKYLHTVAVISLIFISVLVVGYSNKESAGKFVYGLIKSKVPYWGWDFEYTKYRLNDMLLTSIVYSALTLFLLVPLYYLLTRLNLNKQRTKYALIFIVLLDLIILLPFPHFKNISEVYSTNQIEEFLMNDHDAGLFRVFVLKRPIQKGEKYLPVREFIAYKNGIYMVKGRETAFVWTYEKYIKDITDLNVWNKTNELKNLNVKYIVTTRRMPSPKFELVLKINDSYFSVNDTLVYRYAEWSDRFRLMDKESGDVKLESYSNSERILNVNSKKPNVLFISETYLPQWTAKVDNSPAKIELCEGTFMCVNVRKGSHKVELKYEEPFLKPGLIISGITFLITLVVLLLYYMKGGKFSGRFEK